MEHFGLRDARRVEARRWLRRHPCGNLRERSIAHELRDDVGVENDHFRGTGGGRPGWRAGISISTPPTGRTSRAKTSTRFSSAGASSRATASRRMWRASSSMERFRRAARTRRRSLVVSSRSRIVKLATEPPRTRMQSLIALYSLHADFAMSHRGARWSNVAA